MQKLLKENLKILKNHYNIPKILEINEQSFKNKLYANNRYFSLEDVMRISKALNILIDTLVFKDLSKED